jgi:hypothetical protein
MQYSCPYLQLGTRGALSRLIDLLSRASQSAGQYRTAPGPNLSTVISNSDQGLGMYQSCTPG